MPIYLDNAATTKISQVALDEYNRISLEEYANSSSIHTIGLDAKSLLEECRNDIASILGVRASNIYFTSGGTVSDNIAIFTACNKVKDPHSARIISTSVEHHACLNCLKELERRGFDVKYLPMTKEGIDLSMLEELLTPNTILVNMMHVNNETGHAFPIFEAADLVHDKCPDALFHVDGVQGFCKEDFTLLGSHIDSYAASSHKFHGPKGSGILYLSNRYKLTPFTFGGGQERSLISGTENLPGIGAMTVAAKEAYHSLRDNREYVSKLRDMLWDGLSKLDGTYRISPMDGSPYILSVAFKTIPAEIMLNALNNRGVCVSAGAACAGNAKGSHVIGAMGLPREVAAGTIRFSLSTTNTEDDIVYTLKAVNDIISTVFTRFNFKKR